ncbi:MAG: phosphopantetheine-binding protein [Deltaproteobacteria bacterium]|nr:phosphopantetheine-binding protein [Deltaproteobacteria bacterium]
MSDAILLEKELKTLLIHHLKLEDIKEEDILSEAPLFGDGLGLDSIDALELGLLLQTQYGIQIQENSDKNDQYFSSVKALAEFVKNNRQK